MKELGYLRMISDQQLELVLRALNNALRESGVGVVAADLDAVQQWALEHCPCEKCTAARLQEK